MLKNVKKLILSDLSSIYNKAFAQSPYQNKEWTKDFCQLIVKIFKPKSIIDFGCATGDILAPFEKKGLEVLGIDGSKACLKHSYLSKKNSLIFDLRNYYQSIKKYDLCFCLEVAEHLEEKYSRILIKSLVDSSSTIIFTAAPPGQSGPNHINLKPAGWWINIFSSFNFQKDKKLTYLLKVKLKNIVGVQPWYIKNIQVFVKRKKMTKHLPPLNKNEDKKTLRYFENFLKKRRGYVFRMPKPGSKVISFFSGGLDTAATTALLLAKYKLEVYPLHFDRPFPASDRKKTLASVRYLDAYFAKKYKKYHHVKILPLFYPPQSLFPLLYLVGNRIINKKTGAWQGIPFTPAIYIFNAICYVLSLPAKEGNQIRTIFDATLRTNIDLFIYESLTAFRSLNAALCTMLNDYSWQCTSLPIERQIGYYLDKPGLISLIKNLNLPLEKTCTCQFRMRYQCGDCLLCNVRRQAFLEAGIPDKTIYETDRTDVLGLFKRIIYKLIRKKVNHTPQDLLSRI